jgi:ribonuclease HI
MAHNIVQGFQIPWLKKPPPQKHFPNHNLNQEDELFVDQEILRLIQVGAVKEVKLKPRVISPIGVVPKKNNKKRLIVDLRFVNQHIALPSFKMENLQLAMDLVKPKDNFVKIDLKDGYFHGKICTKSQKYLGIQWRDKYYVFQVIPFGLSISPFWFTKMMRVVVKAFRKEGFRMVAYVDDFLFIIKKATKKKVKRILKMFKDFGLQVNMEKSILIPSTKIEFLGLNLDSEQMTISAPKEKIRNVRKLAKYLRRRVEQGLPIKKRTLASLAGLAISISQAVLPARIMLERVYKTMKTAQLWEGTVFPVPGLLKDLSWWEKELKHWNGKSFLPYRDPVVITTDASASGWGATLNQLQASGFWSLEMKKASSNQRELMAVVMALQSFKEKSKNKDVKILSDNATTVAQINLMSGRSEGLNRILRILVNLCSELNIRITAKYLPGIQNTQADALSRQKDKSDWKLNPIIFKELDSMWGPHSIDRFASHLNKQTRRFNSLRNCPEAEAIDAFQQCWKHDVNWVNPPFSLLPRVINLLLEQDLPQATVIAPRWPAQPWWWDLCLIAEECIEIPNNRETFLPGFLGNVEPLKNPKWRVFAFRISGSNKQKTGTQKPENCSCTREAHLRFKHTIRSSRNASNSVMNTRLHSLHTLPLL